MRVAVKPVEGVRLCAGGEEVEGGGSLGEVQWQMHSCCLGWRRSSRRGRAEGLMRESLEGLGGWVGIAKLGGEHPMELGPRRGVGGARSISIPNSSRAMKLKEKKVQVALFRETLGGSESVKEHYDGTGIIKHGKVWLRGGRGGCERGLWWVGTGGQLGKVV